MALIYGTSGNDTRYGTGGFDSIYGRPRNQFSGADGNDTLIGWAKGGFDTSESGTDYIYGGTGNDKLYGGTDRDYLDGDAGNDSLYGGIGNDDLEGEAGNDYLYGGGGDDKLEGGNTKKDYLYGGTGADTFILGSQYSFAGGVYYDIVGNGDYAVINDFNRNQDLIQLAGEQSDYSLKKSPISVGAAAADTAIYYNKEIIGIVADASGLNLGSKYFDYV